MATITKVLDDEVECLMCHCTITTMTLETHMFREHDNDVFTNMAAMSWHKHKRLQELQNELAELDLEEYDCEIRSEVLKARIQEIELLFDKITYKSFINPIKGHERDDSCCCDSCDR